MPIERKRVVFDLTNGDSKPRFVGGVELPNWRDGPTMAEYIERLRGEGWHLVGKGAGQEYVFERVS